MLTVLHYGVHREDVPNAASPQSSSALFYTSFTVGSAGSWVLPFVRRELRRGPQESRGSLDTDRCALTQLTLSANWVNGVD